MGCVQVGFEVEVYIRGLGFGVWGFGVWVVVKACILLFGL